MSSIRFHLIARPSSAQSGLYIALSSADSFVRQLAFDKGEPFLNVQAASRCATLGSQAARIIGNEAL